MTIKDLVRAGVHVTYDTIFIVIMPEKDSFMGTVLELPMCVSSIEITTFEIIETDLRSHNIMKIAVTAKKYEYRDVK